MRTLLKVSMDVDAANRALSDGSMQSMMESVLQRLKPEASFFGTDHGRRTAFIFFDLADPSQIPSIAEPFFSHFKAEVDFMPMMNRDDLMKGLREWSSAKKAA